MEFGCTLPVNKTAIPVARILMCVILQLAQLLTAAMCIALKEAFFPAPNLAGMDANIVLLGWGCVILGAFNICFFPIHFRDPKKNRKAVLSCNRRRVFVDRVIRYALHAVAVILGGVRYSRSAKYFRKTYRSVFGHRALRLVNGMCADTVLQGFF